MNKHLLLGSALLAAISAYPQAGKQKQPARTGIVNESAQHFLNEKETTAKSTAGQPAKKNPPVVKATAGAKTTTTQATSCVRFSASANGAGVYIGGQECLQYNDKLNAITFVHRASTAYTAAPTNGNTGTQVMKWSVNSGTNWDSTVIYVNNTNLGRYPQGGLYNPAGNTNPSNAYVVGMGPTTPGSGWNGSWFASKKLSATALTPGSDQQNFPNTAPFGTLGKKVDFPRYGFAYTQDGFVRALGGISNDINNTTTAPSYDQPRGQAIIKGTFNAGAFVWSYDSLVPPTILRSDGSKQMTNNMADMAWNDAGTVGYVMMIGARAGTSGTMKGWQPIVYKTTTSGATWTLMPAQDFTTSQFQGLADRLWATNSNSNLAVPFFSSREGLDMAVDVNDNLHLVTTVVGSYSNDNDSLDYTVTWGSQKYRFPQNGSFGFPTIYDFYTTTSGGWNYHIVDSMGTEGPSGTSGQGGYGNNQWAGSGASTDARIQISHSPDRKKMFYSWTETDTTISPFIDWNEYPDLQMRGYDVTIDKVTPRVNVTLNVPGAYQTSFMHFMSNRTITTNTTLSTNEIPFTISYNSTFDVNVPTTHYYLKGASFTQADFTINPMRPVGVQNLAANTANYEVSNYPNPANGNTTVMVSLKDAKPFELSIYTSVGQLIKTISVDGQAGHNEVNLDLSNLSAGVYVYSVKASNSVVTKKLIVQ